MSDYVFPPAPQPSLAVTGHSARFPLRRIFCVGRNYADHALEMGGNPQDEPPFFFTKPTDALVPSGATIPYPPMTADFHFEGELVVAIGRGGADIDRAQALDHVFGYAAGNDLTRRDLQAEAKAAGRPWDMAKGFDASAVVGAIHPGAEMDAEAQLETRVGGVVRQSTTLGMMIWPVADIIAALSRYVTLAPGDLVMTGTPAGVGALHPGETCVVSITGLPPAQVTIA
jgi:fumarylpyruvate hydrolase